MHSRACTWCHMRGVVWVRHDLFLFTDFVFNLLHILRIIQGKLEASRSSLSQPYIAQESPLDLPGGVIRWCNVVHSYFRCLQDYLSHSTLRTVILASSISLNC